MSISDESLALCLARALHWEREGYSWDNMTETREDWLKVARRARELLTPDMQMPPFPGSLGPLQPGDVVSVRGVVVAGDGTTATSVRIDDRSGGFALYFDPGAVTFVKHPAPPEPDWQPGDVAQDENGARYSFLIPATGGPAEWRWITGARPRGQESLMWFKRKEIPGTLTPCDVVPREAK